MEIAFTVLVALALAFGALLGGLALGHIIGSHDSTEDGDGEEE